MTEAGTEMKKKRQKHSLLISPEFLSLTRKTRKRIISYFLRTFLPPWITPTKPFSINEVEAVIKDLNPKKAPGYDLITNQILQKLSKMGIKYITQLYSILR